MREFDLNTLGEEMNNQLLRTVEAISLIVFDCLST